MYLSKQTIRCIADTAKHYKDNQELTPESSAVLHCELDTLYNLCHDVPIRFTIKIERVEKVPETNDIVLNLLVKEVLYCLENEDDEHMPHTHDGSEYRIDLENATWEYLANKYKFDPEDHHLLKHTTEEALSYTFHHLGIEL